MTRLVHVLPRLGLTGPVRSLASFVKHGARAGFDWEHHVVALEREVAPAGMLLLRTAGATLHLGLESDARSALLDSSDIVIVHFWQCPSVVEFLADPPTGARVVLWIHTLGLHAPQTVPATAVAGSDAIWCTTSRSVASPALGDLGQPTVVRGLMDPDQVPETRLPHDDVVVGYLGTVNHQKMHPRFVELCAAVRAPAARFVVCGTGGGEDTLRAAAAAAGIGDRLEVRGFVPELADALGRMDLFGYPLRHDTYASSDIAVQEAMWAGLPPVVLPYGGVPDLMEHGVSGFVAPDESEYVVHVARLVSDPAERQRVAARAIAHARAEFDPGATVQRARTLLDALRDTPPVPREPADWGATAATRFVTALAEGGGDFARSLATGPGGDAEAEHSIAVSPELLLAGEGGLFQWRNAYPDDPVLREWTALALDARGDADRAAAERAAAAELRRDPES